MENIWEWYYKGGARPSITTEHIEALLKQDVQTKGSQRAALQDRWRRSYKLSPAQLLVLLQDAIAKDGSMLQLDYFSLDRQCFGVLRKIEAEMHASLVDWYNLTQRKNIDRPPNEVAWALPDFIFERYNEDDPEAGQIGRDMLFKASRTMQAFVERDQIP